ncbi:hypothetical protein MESS2_820016 [Mesorhizobium metallidurans STM 2683]|uniref:Uncharacterized protein n=1 Tax=Mesorhizobium metallidurans STM 2683 TaxID=1297569 RepID=M5FAX0_9HYPH|nr:hypothetical protein MESS2_820016 [Mesorhizobium metallidurans STM 2683]
MPDGLPDRYGRISTQLLADGYPIVPAGPLQALLLAAHPFSLFVSLPTSARRATAGPIDRLAPRSLYANAVRLGLAAGIVVPTIALLRVTRDKDVVLSESIMIRAPYSLGCG